MSDAHIVLRATRIAADGLTDNGGCVATLFTAELRYLLEVYSLLTTGLIAIKLTGRVR